MAAWTCGLSCLAPLLYPAAPAPPLLGCQRVSEHTSAPQPQMVPGGPGWNSRDPLPSTSNQPWSKAGLPRRKGLQSIPATHWFSLQNSRLGEGFIHLCWSPQKLKQLSEWAYGRNPGTARAPNALRLPGQHRTGCTCSGCHQRASTQRTGRKEAPK